MTDEPQLILYFALSFALSLAVLIGFFVAVSRLGAIVQLLRAIYVVVYPIKIGDVATEAPKCPNCSQELAPRSLLCPKCLDNMSWVEKK